MTGQPPGVQRLAPNATNCPLGKRRPDDLEEALWLIAAVVKNRLGDLLAHPSGNEVLVVCVSQLISSLGLRLG